MTQIKQKLLFYIKYLWYLIKYLWYLLKRWFVNPKRRLAHRFGGLATIVIVLLTAISWFSYPYIYRYITTPKAPPLRQAPVDSPFLFTASSDSEKESLKVFIGESVTNNPKIEIDFGETATASFELKNLNPNLKTPNKKGNKLTFSDVRDQIDLTYEPLVNGIKEEIIIKTPIGDNAFTFTLNSQGASPKMTLNGDFSPVFYDSVGAYAFHFVKPYAYDSNGDRTDNVAYKIKKTSADGEYEITVIADKKWLDDSARVYPVAIDPTIIHDTNAEFATGQMNRVTDTGSGASPNLTTYYQELPADINTVGLWHLNEASGNALDSSGNGNTGTPTGTTIVTGKFGNARSFAGSISHIVTVPDSNYWTFGTGDFSIELWVNPSVITGNYEGIISTYNGNGFILTTSYGTDGHLAWWNVTNGWIDTGVSLDLNTWQHLAVTRTSGTINIYKNGSLINTTASWTGNIDGTNLTFGGWDSGYAYLTGMLDEIRISKVARTPEEIKLDASRRPYSIYTSDVIDMTNVSSWNPLTWTELGVTTGDGETPYSSTGLVAQWNFNETSGTSAADSSGNANTGTVTNMTTSGQDTAAGDGWTAANKRWGAGGLMFDGTDGHVTFANSLSSKTIETWIKPVAIASINILQLTSTATVTTDASGKVTAGAGFTTPTVYVNGSSASPYLVSGQWNHIAVTTDTTVTTNTGYLGRVGTSYFKGVMDSTRIYSRALTASEILSNYQAANVEFQTRVGANTSPDDGSWEAWKPTTGETAIASMDSDSANWTWDNTATYMPQVKSNESNIKAEGTGSLKQIIGQPQVDANTVALWHLDETGGTGAYLKDSTTNAYNLTPTLTSLTTGVSNRARSFNGTSDYLSRASITPYNNSRTIEFWFKPAALGTQRGILSAGNSVADTSPIWLIVQTSGNLLSVYHAGAYRNGTTVLQARNWYHGAYTFNSSGNAVVLYLNGNLEYSGTVADSNLNNTNLYIGTGYNAYFSGSIDEVRISNTARTAEEIAEAYRAGRDHYLNRTISSTDLSTKTSLPFYVASDRQGTFLSATIGESAYANYQTDANTVGFWHLDEQSGSGAYIKDNSGNANNGTPTGTTFTQGKIGKARSFNGSSDYISVPTISIANNITAEAWVYSSNYGAAMFIVQKAPVNTMWELFFYGGLLYWRGGSTTAVTCTAPTNNQWHYVVGTQAGTTATLFIDGVQCKTGAVTAIGNGSGNIEIGRHDGPGYYFSGIIDEVRVSNTARTADEIRQAYEVGARTHNITIDFKAALNSGNLIASTSDTSFTIDATAYGASSMGSNLYFGDKIIVKENYDGTEYIAQGTVNAVTASTGAVTVSAWDSGSTVPTGGFTVNATVFKWQREYFDLRGSLSTHRDAVTNLTLRVTDGSQGANVWLDDFRSSGGYLTTPAGSTVGSSIGNRYAQYRFISLSYDSLISSSVTSATLTYASSLAPPTIGTPTVLSATSIRWNFTDNANDEEGFKVYDTNNVLKETCTPANLTYCDETGLPSTPNTQYTRKVASYSGGSTGTYSDTASIYTLAAVPIAPEATRSATTIDIIPSAGTNPASTELAIYKEEGSTCTGSGGSYIDSAGAATASAVWQTAATWGTKTITGLNQEKSYSFCTKARNGNNVETTFSSGGTSNGSFIPLSGDFTITINASGCGNRYVDGNNLSRYVCGVDSGTDTNTAKLTLQSGIFILLENETLVTGSLDISNGSMIISEGAQIKVGSNMYALDVDGDGYPGSPYIYAGTVKPTIDGKTAVDIKRKNVMTTLTTTDCNDAAYSAANSCCGAGDTPSTVGSELYGTTCKKCVSEVLTNQTSAEDLFTQCTASYNACSGNYRIGPDGNCSGTGASCKTTGLSSACPANDCSGGCSDGSCVAITTTWTCDSCCNDVGHCGGTCTGCASGPFAGCNPTNYDVWNDPLHTCYCSYCAIYFDCNCSCR